MVNELRLGYVRGVYGDSITEEIDPTAVWYWQYDSATRCRGIFLSSGTALNYGGFSASVLQTIQNTYQIADNVSMVRGPPRFQIWRQESITTGSEWRADRQRVGPPL